MSLPNANSPHPTPRNATRPTHAFALRAVSLGVQIAMASLPFLPQLVIASETPIIKRQKNPANQLTNQPTSTPTNAESVDGLANSFYNPLTNHSSDNTTNLAQNVGNASNLAKADNATNHRPQTAQNPLSTNPLSNDNGSNDQLSNHNSPKTVYNPPNLASNPPQVAYGTPTPSNTLSNTLTGSSDKPLTTLSRTTVHNNTPSDKLTQSTTKTTDNQTLGVFYQPSTANQTPNNQTITNKTGYYQTPNPNAAQRSPIISRKTASNALRSQLALAGLYKRPANTCYGTWHYPSVDSTLMGRGLSASADYGYYDNVNYGELSGNVQIYQDGRTLFADKVVLNPTTKAVNATGQVLFASDDVGANLPFSSNNNLTNRLNNPKNPPQSNAIIGIAERVQYNLNTGQADAYDLAFAHNGLHAHGYANALNTHNPNQTVLYGTSFSTCPPDRRHWELSADSITLDKETGRGIAKHTALKIKDTTVLKLPYFNFPIDDRRASGFLLPHIGINSPDGVELSTPYYFNLAPNYDATLTPTLYSNKNPKIAGEFRYLTQHYGQGNLQGAFLPNDRQYNDNHRGHLFFDHEWRANDSLKNKFGIDGKHPIDNVSISATYRYISDSNYLNDFDNLGLSDTILNLPRRLAIQYQTPHLSANLNAETFQKLTANDENGQPLLDKDRPYARLPQLSVQYKLPNTIIKQYAPNWLDGNNLTLTGTHDIAYFKKSIKDNSDSEKSGVRAYHRLEASYPITKSYGYIHPKVSIAHLHTAYDEDSLDDQNLTKKDGKYSATVPRLSLDSGLFFQKNGVPFGWLDKNSGGYQLISPRLKYLYSPYKNQDNMPNFETSVASISYDQLLSDNWFLGYDRLSDLHAITPALNYRYVDKFGQTRVELGIAEQFFLDDIKVGLDGNPSQAGAVKGKSTGLSWQASISPYQGVWLDGAGSFTRSYNANALMLSARYQPNANTLFNVGMVNRKADLALGQLPLFAYTGGAIFSLSPNWQVIASTQYDSKKHKFMENLLGINYEDCCIGVSVYGREYRNDLRPSDSPTRAIMAEIRLNGLSGKNSGRLNRLLSDKILGFENIESTWRGTAR